MLVFNSERGEGWDFGKCKRRRSYRCWECWKVHAPEILGRVCRWLFFYVGGVGGMAHTDDNRYMNTRLDKVTRQGIETKENEGVNCCSKVMYTNYNIEVVFGRCSNERTLL